MEREIKFRVWDSESKEMRDYDFLYTSDVRIFAEANWFLKELMQFTGLKDKNGKEIYEGDLLNSKVHSEQNNWASPLVFKNENAFLVSFKNGCFVNEMDQPISEWIVNIVSHKTEYEVIGNIYENPELLR